MTLAEFRTVTNVLRQLERCTQQQLHQQIVNELADDGLPDGPRALRIGCCLLLIWRHWRRSDHVRTLTPAEAIAHLPRRPN